MKPLNARERSAALAKFLGLYFLILIIPMAAMLLAFYAPNEAVKEENRHLKALLEEQRSLLARLDTLGAQFKALERMDKELEQLDKGVTVEFNEMEKAQRMKQIEHTYTAMQAVVWQTERDSAYLLAAGSRQTAKGIINTFDAMLTYRKTIDLLRKANQEKGINTEIVEKLNGELKACQQQAENIKLIAVQAGSGNAREKDKDAGPTQQELERLKKKLQDYQQQLAQCQQQPAREPARIVVADADKVEELQTSLHFALADCNLLRAGEMRSAAQRRQLYNAALQGFAAMLHPDAKESVRKAVKAKVDQINQQLKNMDSKDF
jgi:type I site-specific restriction-modification system R (restriction) subunit